MALTDSFWLRHEIGRGAAGVVWEATRLGPVAQAVAIKRLHPGVDERAAGRLSQEAAVLADLDHPHVVGVLDVVDDGGALALVMPLARGGSLADLLAERGRLSAGEVVAVGAPVADALASAHRRGLVHGDVKPSNILFTADGEPLLADFGVARVAGAPGQEVAGTSGYLAPEVASGAAPHGRADVYALGATCRNALAGDASVPGALTTVIDAALAPEPGDRTSSASALAAGLRGAVPADAVTLPGPALRPLVGSRAADEPGTRTFGPRPPHLPPHPPERPRAASALATLVIGLVAVVLLLAVRSSLAGDDGRTAPPAAPEPSSPCRPFPPLDAPDGAQLLDADVNGDGCPVPVAFDGQELAVRRDPADGAPARYRIDRRGRLLFGDWDCDGRDSPALYLAAGELVSDRGLADLASERGVAAAPGGEPRVARNTDGCDEVVVGRPPT